MAESFEDRVRLYSQMSEQDLGRLASGAYGRSKQHTFIYIIRQLFKEHLEKEDEGPDGAA